MEATKRNQEEKMEKKPKPEGIEGTAHYSLSSFILIVIKYGWPPP
jgi:hypothetical protein